MLCLSVLNFEVITYKAFIFIESLVGEKNQELKSKDETIAEKDKAIEEKEKDILEKSASITSLKDQVASLEVRFIMNIWVRLWFWCPK